MIKSTKLERMAIEARLRDALAIKGNSDIEATLNTIVDYNNVEKIFLKLHQQYENLFICEYHNANTFDGQYRGPGAKYDLERERAEFIKSFNELAELFSNVGEVQRQKRATDKIIDSDSKGAAAIVRGGKNHGVHVNQSPLQQAIASGKPTKWNLSAITSAGHVGVVKSCIDCNAPFAPRSVNELTCPMCRTMLANKVKAQLKSGSCIDCGKQLTFSNPSNPLCNSCFLKTLVYVCQDCKQTFAPSDVNQKTCVSCQNINTSAANFAKVVAKAQSIKKPTPPNCNQCKQPFKRGVHPFLCNSCAAIIAGVAVPKKKNVIQRFFSAVFKMV